MGEPTGWFKNGEDSYTIFYVDPYKDGYSKEYLSDVIPLYGNWKEKLIDIEEQLTDEMIIHCDDDGNFKLIKNQKYKAPISNPEPPKTIVDIIANSIISGINSI